MSTKLAPGRRTAGPAAVADVAVAVDAVAVAAADVAVPAVPVVPTVVGAADNDTENYPHAFLSASAFSFFSEDGKADGRPEQEQ